MVEIRPDEVSAIIREQLSNFKTDAELQEVGTVLQVGDGIARIYGLTKVQSGELIEFANGVQAIVLNLEEDNVGAVLLGASNDIKEGDTDLKSFNIDHDKIFRIPMIKRASEIAGGKSICERICLRLKDIFIQTTEMGYGHAEEMFYLEILDEFYDEIAHSYGDYGQIWNNMVLPMKNVHYIYWLIFGWFYFIK